MFERLALADGVGFGRWLRQGDHAVAPAEDVAELQLQGTARRGRGEDHVAVGQDGILERRGADIGKRSQPAGQRQTFSGHSDHGAAFHPEETGLSVALAGDDDHAAWPGASAAHLGEAVLPDADDIGERPAIGGDRGRGQRRVLG